VWLNLFEPCYQGGALRAASGKQVPEGKARTQQYDTSSRQIEMLAQIIVAITNIAGAEIMIRVCRVAGQGNTTYNEKQKRHGLNGFIFLNPFNPWRFWL
jgi:hypothetical protein